MGHNTRVLFVAALVLLAAGVAAANNPLSNAPPPGLTVNGSLTEPSSSPTTTTAANRETSTPGVTANGATAPAPSLMPTTGASETTAGTPAIDRIVSITRTVEPGAAAVNAFTVPAGQHLVVTDVVVTNPGATPACGASVSPGGNGTPGTGTPGDGTTGNGTPANGTTGTGTPASGTPTGATPALAPGESGTGLLCVPAQTSLNLGLSTGLEFPAGQSVLLANTLPAAATPPAGPLHYHLRGFLVTPGGA